MTAAIFGRLVRPRPANRWQHGVGCNLPTTYEQLLMKKPRKVAALATCSSAAEKEHRAGYC